MGSIGERLRQERLRRGIDLYDIAERTKIHASLLQAIESDEIDKLPGSFFTRSFVRQYARALGLDEGEFETELKRITHFEAPPFAEPEAPHEREADVAPMRSAFEPRGQHSIGALIAFLLILAACSAIYVLWQRSRETGRTEASPPPAASGLAPAKYAQPAADKPGDAPAAPAPAEKTASQAAAAAIRIELRATEPAWVFVAADGNVLYTGTIQPNELRTFEGGQAMTLRTGNAGALDVLFNGKAVGAIGPAHEVRTVEFSPADFKVLGPPPKPPAPAPGDDGL